MLEIKTKQNGKRHSSSLLPWFDWKINVEVFVNCFQRQPDRMLGSKLALEYFSSTGLTKILLVTSCYRNTLADVVCSAAIFGKSCNTPPSPLSLGSVV